MSQAYKFLNPSGGQRSNVGPKKSSIGSAEEGNESSSSAAPEARAGSVDSVLCNLCGKEVDGRFVHALGKTWHPEHFECTKCKSAILAPKFNQKDGQPYCEDCYAQMFLKKCEVCHEPIREKVIVAMDKTYHAHHFTCAVCKEELNDTFFEKDGRAYCETCNIRLFAPECHRCKKPILDTAIVALDKKWHQDCFVCGKCGALVKEKTFQVEDDMPLCSDCATVQLN